MAYLGLGSAEAGIELLQKFAVFIKNYPDAPANFIPPRLVDPTYVPQPRSNRTAITNACIFLAVLPTIVVLARLFTRQFRRSQALGLDDAAIAIALLAGVGFWTTNLLLIEKGKVGYHIYDITYAEIKIALRLQIANIVFYIFTISFVRLSVIFFTLRLNAKAYKWLNTTIWVTVAVQVVWMITILCLALFSCQPVPAMWDFDARLAGGQCKTLYPAMVGTAAIWVVLDIWVVSLPIPAVLQLHMPTRTKIGVALLFGLGYAASAASLVRVFLIKPVYNTWDPNWKALNLLLWDEIEIGVGFIAASLPALNAVIVKIFPKWFASPVSSTAERLPSEKALSTSS